jgi:hypothetical protein
MDKYKFSLANVIAVLTAVAFGFVCFLGANFYTLGGTKKSLIFAGIITVLLAALPNLAKWLKGVQGNFKTYFIAEVVVILLFTGVTAFFTYSPFSHFFTVSDRKVEIQNQLSDNIKQAQNMFSRYESYANSRITSYNDALKSIVKAEKNGLGKTTKSKKLGFLDNAVSYETQATNKIVTINDDLFPANYTNPVEGNGIKEVAIDWLADQQEKTTGWKPIGIVEVIKDIEEKSISWRNDLVENSTIREAGEVAADFDYPLTFPNVKTNFTTLGTPTPLAIGLAVLAWLLMLLPWFITERSTKGFGRLAPYEIEL